MSKALIGRGSVTDDGVLVGGVKSCDHGYLVYPRYPDLPMLGWSIQKRTLDYLQEWPIKTWTFRVERIDGVNDFRLYSAWFCLWLTFQGTDS